jgi:small subunit ribosomal protein S2
MALQEIKKTKDKARNAVSATTLSRTPRNNTKAAPFLLGWKGQGGRGKKKLKVGDLCRLKISALGPKGIGIDEYSYPYSIFVSSAITPSPPEGDGGDEGDKVAGLGQVSPGGVGTHLNLGDTVKAKIVLLNLKEDKYAIAQILTKATALSVAPKGGASSAELKELKELKEGAVANLPYTPGVEKSVALDEVLTVNIEKLTPKGAGLVDLKGGYKFIIPNATIGNNQKVLVTRLKEKYGFAKIMTAQDRDKDIMSLPQAPIMSCTILKGHQEKTKLLEGSKYTLTLPPTVNGGPPKYGIVKLHDSVVFIKLNLTAGLGQQLAPANYPYPEREGVAPNVLLDWAKYGKVKGTKVRIKVTKINNKFAIAKIVQINPMSLLKKRILVQNSIRQMIKNGMHLGEKAVKCNARMKNYVWLKKPAAGFMPRPGSLPFGAEGFYPTRQVKGYGTSAGLGQLCKGGAFSAGLKEGSPLIKKGRHIINLLKTRRCLNKALTQLSKYALKGRTFLFIGTKKPAAGLIARASVFSKTSFFVNTRWLGGMLTNWKTILKSISKIRPILKEKQKIVADILEKRQTLKLRLIKKALFLKKKSKLILSKGRFLIDQFKYKNTSPLQPQGLEGKGAVQYPLAGLGQGKGYLAALIIEKTKNLAVKRKQLVENCYSLLPKRQVLLAKRRELMFQSVVLKEKGIKVLSRYKNLLNELTIYSKKLRELKYLLLLSNEIKTIKNKAIHENKQIRHMAYGRIKDLLGIKGQQDKNIMSFKNNILPNPPKEILNLILLTMKSKYEGFTDLTLRGTYPPGAYLAQASKGVTGSANTKVLALSRVVSKFGNFEPYLKGLIKTYEQNIKEIQNLLAKSTSTLTKIKTTLQEYLDFKNILVKELNTIKTKLIIERNTIRVIKNKLKHFKAQKKLIKFLPRLRYLATPLFTTKIAETVKILMQKIVDPKLKYPVDNIYDEKLGNNSKKVSAARKKKWQRLEKYFGGIANMTKMTKSQISKNVAIVVGQKEEINAVRECQKLGIKMFNIVDTNCNPSFADHIIPANDDSRNSIKYVLNKFLVRIRLAQKLSSRKKMKKI